MNLQNRNSKTNQFSEKILNELPKENVMVPLKFKKVQHLLVTVFRMNTIVQQIVD